MNWLQPWHLLILLLVVVVLFGAKRLPDAARSVGKSMKIFKAETKGLREDHDQSDAASVQDAETRRLTGATAAPVSNNEQQIADLQRQLDELKKQQGTSEQSPKNAS